VSSAGITLRRDGGAIVPAAWTFLDVLGAPVDGVTIGSGFERVHTHTHIPFRGFESLTPNYFIASILLLVTWLYFSSVVLLLGAAVNAVGIGPPDATDDDREESSVLDTEMTTGEAATHLQRLREDLTERSSPSSERTVVERNPPRDGISITEWARGTEDGTTHEVRFDTDYCD
jgi:membrane protein